MSHAFIRYRNSEGQSRVGLAVGNRAIELPVDDVNELITRYSQLGDVIGELLEAPVGEWSLLEELELLAPVSPQQVLQAGANYRTHVMDLAVAHRPPDDPLSDEEVRQQTAVMMDKRSAEGEPYFFLGLPTVIAAANADLTLPGYSDQHDWELELAAVVGERAFRVSEEEALDHLFGYTMINDITTRDLVFRKDMPEIGTDWYRAKNAPGFLPTGPLLVPAGFIDNPQDLRLTLKLNGQAMQDETTADMIFNIAKLVSEASQVTPLLPGDLVLTGSPAGNGAHWGRLLRDGDVMEATITGLGTQRVLCRDESMT